MRRLPLLASTALACLALTACQKTVQKAVDMTSATAAVCGRLEEVGKALERVQALKPTSTVGDAQAANAQLGQALQGLEQAEGTLAQLRLGAFQTTLKGFRQELTKVSGEKGMSLEQAAADLQTKAAPVIAARKQLSATVNCDAPASP
jgi:hypothetical protein